ncbi:hypothetical protein FISHEDRAFT_11607, partial [Fistulina hepatica ATCC 64428]
VDAALFNLLRGYAALTPPARLKYPLHLSTQEVHDFLITNVLCSDHLHTYSPSAEYQKSFWKWAISHLERNLDCEDNGHAFEIDERVYHKYTTLLSHLDNDVSTQVARHVGPPTESYITHFWKPLDRFHPSVSDINSNGNKDIRQLLSTYQSITLRESRTTIEAGTTGLRTWRASHVFAQYLIHHPKLVVRRHVFELGCGVGFLGIVVAALQIVHGSDDAVGVDGARLWLSDGSAPVLARCKSNVELECNLSSKHPAIHYTELDWTNVSADYFSNANINPDIVLGADVIFEPSIVPPLARTIRLAVHARHTDALIALTVRNEDTLNAFLSAL